VTYANLPAALVLIALALAATGILWATKTLATHVANTERRESSWLRKIL